MEGFAVQILSDKFLSGKVAGIDVRIPLGLAFIQVLLVIIEPDL